jgi:putative colanic acid biosynthesis acetyltransferase WcaF
VSKVRLDTFNNEWYNPGRNFLIRLIWYYLNTWFIHSGWLPSSGFKVRLLRLFGAKIGTGVVIKPYVNIKYPWFLTIGNYSWIGENVWIDNLTQVHIGNHVCISQGALLLTGNHNYKDAAFGLITGSIRIEDGCWIGAQSCVCPGVTCNQDSVLSVQSVANADLLAGGIYQGNPAKFKKYREIHAES